MIKVMISIYYVYRIVLYSNNNHNDYNNNYKNYYNNNYNNGYNNYYDNDYNNNYDNDYIIIITMHVN